MTNDGSRGYPRAGAALALLALAGTVTSTHGADLSPSQYAIVNTGQHLYQLKCATCHGSDGHGDGPFATLLNVAPSDLTLLARKAGGEFPFWQVYEMISGNELMPAHGTREMPIWGQELVDEAANTNVEAQTYVRGRIFALLTYLLQIQQR
jgi:mono/diheme cytochrome c family protein